MSSPWHEVRELTGRLVSDPRQATRLTNLAIAAQCAQERALAGRALWTACKRLARSPLPRRTGGGADLTRFAKAAARAAEQYGPHDMSTRDAWVHAFQGHDAHRKTRGAYATPWPLAVELARVGLRPLLRRGLDAPRIVDPSAGAGALLLAALGELLRGASSSDHARRIVLGLRGVELDPVAHELCCVLIWLTVGSDAGVSLDEIAERIVCDNALTRDWWTGQEPADLVLMNPPWESLRHKVRKQAELREVRRATVERLTNPEPGARGLPNLYTAQGRGDRNLFKMFVELAPHLVGPGGRLALLLPGAFGSDLGLSALRRLYLDELRVQRWTSFENRAKYFPIDSRYKFGILSARRDARGTTSLRVRSFATQAAEVRRPHLRLTRRELTTLGGPSAMLPEITAAEQVEVLDRALNRGYPLFGLGPLGTVRYRREVDLTLDRAKGLFGRTEETDVEAVEPWGERCLVGGETRVPLIEGRMVGQYDFFQKSWEEGWGRTARWSLNAERGLQDCVPQFLAPRRGTPHSARVALCDVTSATNTRTVHATWVPPTWQCGNTAPVLEFITTEQALAATAILNSLVFDWIARQIVSGLHLNKFYLQALVWPALEEADLSRLAALAAGFMARSPRLTDLGPGGEQVARLAGLHDPVVGHLEIESAVARGFGLTRAMLEVVLDPSPAIRRGFWRHFESDPYAPIVAERLRSEYAPRRAPARATRTGAVVLTSSHERAADPLP